MTTFKTTEAYISGGICGHMWWPDAMAGKPYRVNLRGTFGLLGRFSEPATLRDALLLALSENGGDFQNAAFTGDTELVIIRKRPEGPYRYSVHVRTRQLSGLPSVADLVNEQAYTGDFMGEED